jgi:hypothetical protein
MRASGRVCLSWLLQLRARVGLAPLEYHLLIFLLRAITKSRRNTLPSPYANFVRLARM